jgi:hypothetical protein
MSHTSNGWVADRHCAAAPLCAAALARIGLGASLYVAPCRSCRREGMRQIRIIRRRRVFGSNCLKLEALGRIRRNRHPRPLGSPPHNVGSSPGESLVRSPMSSLGRHLPGSTGCYSTRSPASCMQGCGRGSLRGSPGGPLVLCLLHRLGCYLEESLVRCHTSDLGRSLGESLVPSPAGNPKGAGRGSLTVASLGRRGGSIVGGRGVGRARA